MTATQTESQSQAELNTLQLPRQTGAQVLNSTHSSYQGKSGFERSVCFNPQPPGVITTIQTLNAVCSNLRKATTTTTTLALNTVRSTEANRALSTVQFKHREANSAGVECNIMSIPPRPTACKHKRKSVKQENKNKKTFTTFLGQVLSQ